MLHSFLHREEARRAEFKRNLRHLSGFRHNRERLPLCIGVIVFIQLQRVDGVPLFAVLHADFAGCNQL
ncbi:hypothetical protein D3C80_1848680 [compost metagenome]